MATTATPTEPAAALLLRMPPELKDEIHKRALADNVNMTAWVLGALADMLDMEYKAPLKGNVGLLTKKHSPKGSKNPPGSKSKGARARANGSPGKRRTASRTRS